MVTDTNSKARSVIRTVTLAGLGLLTVFWAGLLVYLSMAFVKRGRSGVADALIHLVSNPFEAQPPSSAAMIGALCVYGAMTALIAFAYWRLFVRRDVSGRR